MKPVNILFLSIWLSFFSCTKPEVFIIANITSKEINEVKKVMVILGSSTAFGTGAMPIDSSWVNRLNYKFKDDGKNISMYNLALGGYTTYHILPSHIKSLPNKPLPDAARNLDKALSYKPDFIIINLPSNDIAYGFTDVEILDNYKIICEEIKRLNIPFLITSTQPRNFAEAQQRERLVTINNVVKTAFSKNTIDFYNLLADPVNNIKTELNFGDGIHLNNKGHKIIFDEFFKDKRMRLALGY